MERKIRIKYYKQKKGYSCGAAVIRMILNYYRKKISEEEPIRLMNISEKTGASHKKMINIIRRFGFKVCSKNNSNIKELIGFINKRFPIIVNYFDFIGKEGHYAVLYGYDEKRKN